MDNGDETTNYLWIQIIQSRNVNLFRGDCYDR